MAAQTQHPQLSLAVWDLPATVVAGERFTIKAGAKSSTGSDLRGCRIEACDTAEAVIASAELSATPWPGTDALAWTELAMTAPAPHGVMSLSVRLSGASLDPPHRDTQSRFTVMVTPPPQYTFAIEVVAKETAAPLGGTEIRLGAHRATTATSGKAEVRLAKGRYNLHIWKVGFDAPSASVDIDGDMTLRVEAVTVPEENADRAWRA